MESHIIDLSGKWISSLIQNNKIYNEKVYFTQTNNNIEADIILNYDDNICKYKFRGIINKNIINGTYEQIDDQAVESGTISLKIINDDFLFGVTTYFADNDTNDITQSPYALFRNTNNNLGTFDPCSKCVGNNANCCCNTSIDSPMILPNEAQIISNNMKINIDKFANIVDFSKMHNDYSLKQLYQMKRQPNNQCFFYQNNSCAIYDFRPIDCRIFPYDIKLKKDGNYYLVYYKSNSCGLCSERLNDIQMISYNTRIFLRLLMPYIREWTDNYCSKNLTKNNTYEIICKIEDLF